MTSCNAGYYRSGDSCLLMVCTPNAVDPCAENNGTGTHQCYGNGSAYGTCNLTACNYGYYMSGVNMCSPWVCTPNAGYACAVTNGTGSMTCNSIGSALGACTVTGCNAGYALSGGVCVLSITYVYSWRTGGFGGVEALWLIGHRDWRPNVSFWCSKENDSIPGWPERSVGTVDDSMCPQPKPVERCHWTAYPNNDVIIENQCY